MTMEVKNFEQVAGGGSFVQQGGLFGQHGEFCRPTRPLFDQKLRVVPKNKAVVLKNKWLNNAVYFGPPNIFNRPGVAGAVL